MWLWNDWVRLRGQGLASSVSFNGEGTDFDYQVMSNSKYADTVWRFELSQLEIIGCSVLWDNLDLNIEKHTEENYCASASSQDLLICALRSSVN